MEAKRIYSQYDRPSSHYWNVDVDAETESIVWNYWGRTHDDGDDDEAAIVQCEEGEEEDGNYMV
jgi:hypothetical protein